VTGCVVEVVTRCVVEGVTGCAVEGVTGCAVGRVTSGFDGKEPLVDVGGVGFTAIVVSLCMEQTMQSMQFQPPNPGSLESLRSLECLGGDDFGVELL
jgi:hypothetical protein